MTPAETEVAPALGDVSKSTYKREATLRCGAIDGAADTSRLVVVLPVLRPPRRVKFDRALAEALQPTGAHLLMVNADDRLYFGPGRRMRGLLTLAQLVQDEADRRQVAMADVTLVGRQLGGSVALWTAARVPVGRVIAGMAPIRMARYLRALAQRGDGSAEPGGPDVADWSLDAQLDDPKIERWLDRVIGAELGRVTEPLAIDLFAAGRVGREMTRLHHDLARHATITSTLVDAEAGGPEFPAFAHSLLAGAA
jgi:hypothetical protein